MKILTIIGVVQVLLLGFLISKLFLLESRLDNMDGSTQKNTPQNAVIDDDSQQTLTAGEVRSIVSDELAAWNPSWSATSEPVAAPRVDPLINTATVDEDALSQIESEMTVLMSDGEMSPGDMVKMDRAIAALAPAERREMLNRLTKRMSANNVIIRD